MRYMPRAAASFLSTQIIVLRFFNVHDLKFTMYTHLQHRFNSTLRGHSVSQNEQFVNSNKPKGYAQNR